MQEYINNTNKLQNKQQFRKQKLQKAYPGFGYQMISRQMILDDDNSSKNIIDIIKLMQLYMIGVQVLQSSSDARFVYFSKKIQNLMLKKSIIQQLHEQSKGKKLGSFNSATKDKAEKAQRLNKKDRINAQIYYHQGQYDYQRVNEILKIANSKLEKFKGSVNYDLKKQEDKLKERIHMRRMKSQSGSIHKFEETTTNKQIKRHQQIIDPRMQYFSNIIEQKKKRKGSISKQKQNGKNKSTRYII